MIFWARTTWTGRLRPLSLLSAISIALLSMAASVRAQPQFPQELINQLDQYKTDGVLVDEQRWFTSKITAGLEHKLGRYVIQEMLQQSLEKLREKLHIRYIRINEKYNAADLNIFIIDRKNDPHKIIDRVRARDNAVTFPSVRLIIIDEQLLNSIMDADFSVSADIPTADFRLSNTDRAQRILSLQLLNSVAGVQAPAIVLNTDVEQAFFRLKTYTGFLVILHEVGHVYAQHSLSAASYFRPGKEAENVEIEADNFAILVLDSLGYTKLKDVIITQAQMGIAATLSYYLRKNYGFGIAEYYFKADKDNNPVRLILTYRLLDLHPPLEYRLLLINSTLQKRSAPDATNPYRDILSGLNWSWKLF